MMNVRLKFRKPPSFVVPKGPSFRWARTILSEINGTEITFKAPKHRPEFSNNAPFLPERRYHNNGNTLNFRNYYDEEKAARGLGDHWRDAEFFTHAWAFCGPWFSGTVAELSLSFNILKAVNYPEGISLFHPRVLEQVIGDYLSELFSHQLDETRGYIQEFDGPVNWQPLSLLPVNCVKLEVVSKDFSPHRTIKHMVFFPIADNLLASLIFYPSRLINLPRSELDKRVSVEPLHDLMNNIINNFQLQLSPESNAQ